MTTVGTKGDSQGAEVTPINANSQESSNNISKDEWLISIESYVYDTTKKSQIEKVPLLLRQMKSHKNCFDPLVVSIGPYHHGKPELQAFEKLKIPIAQKFCRARFNQVSISQLYEEVEKVGRSARECYEKDSTKGYDDEMFNKMMFLDACFVLYTMFYVGGEDDELKLKKSHYLVLRDLFLLENQVPLLVLKVLMNFRLESESESGEELIRDFLHQTATIMPPQENSSNNDDKKLDLDGSPHLLHLMREQLIKPTVHESTNETNTLYSWVNCRPVTELQSAGIHFKPSQTRDVTDVKFKSHLSFGTLTIPRILVDDSTKPLLLNLVAYEMCPHGPSKSHITSYICLMDSIIDHADDVKELRKKKIIFNCLGSDEDLAQLFNGIANNLEYDCRIYADTLRKIDNHCKNRGHVWMTEWMNEYFSSPWALFTFLGATLALALTAVDTLYTALYYYKQ